MAKNEIPVDTTSARKILEFMSNNEPTPENMESLCEQMTKQELLTGFSTIVAILDLFSPTVRTFIRTKQGYNVLMSVLDNVDAGMN